MPDYKWPDNVTDERREIVAAIMWTIYDNSPITSDDGRATAALMALLQDADIEISSPWLSKTLVDLERRGAFGHFINRQMNGKRTFAITCVRDPDKDAFPPRPWADEAESEDEPEETEAIDEDGSGEITDIDAGFERIPGVALETVPEVPLADKILYIVSLLNEILTDQLTAPTRRFEQDLDAKLTAVNRLLEENQALRDKVEALTDDKRKLARALETANQMLRDQAARGANGHQREAVPV